MTKAEYLQSAAAKLSDAIVALTAAKEELRNARSDQHIPLAVKLAELEELHDILIDPECTPELYAVGGSE